LGLVQGPKKLREKLRRVMAKTKEEQLAYLDRKQKALDDPDHWSRLWTRLENGNAVDFNINADRDAEVQMVIDCDGINVFVNMMMEDAQSVYERLGLAIAERKEEVEFLGPP
jgi:hypothetical protein